MLTQGEDVEAHALKERGWSISAIARHLGRDRKTVRSYLDGDRQSGVRATATADPLAECEVHIRARFVDDPHLWATSLFDEVVTLATSGRIRASSARFANAGYARIARRARG